MIKNNVIEEIQELVRQIKSNWQEGIDFKNLIIEDKKVKDYASGALQILSPRLKKFCREKFNFPLGVNDYLDYSKEYQENCFFYRTNRDNKHDYLGLSIDGRPIEYFFSSQKDFEEWRKKNLKNRWDDPEEEKPENCSVCGKLVLLKDGRMKLWNDECRTIGVNEDGYSLKFSKPFALAHFHPECAKRYFADKQQQPSENNTRIKEKLLRNLDKICLDPNGYLANNEYLKTDRAEEEYHKLFNSDSKGWKERYLKIVIEDEEIDLEIWDNSCPEYYEVKKALIQKIKSEIKKNPSEWKIEVGKEKNYSGESNNRLIKHISGQKHWKYAISYLWGDNNNESLKHWAEITSQLSEISDNDLINNSQSNQNNHQLSIGLTLGVGGVILVGIIHLFATKKRKNNKYK